MKNPMKKAVGKKVSEYGGMEKYSSKKAEMKHEKKEGKAMEMKEKSMYAKSQPDPGVAAAQAKKKKEEAILSAYKKKAAATKAKAIKVAQSKKKK